MNNPSSVLIKAEFNPKIKTYILLVVAFFLFISVFGIPLLIFWFLGFGNYVSKRYYDNLKCNLTNHHLEFKKGVLFKVEKTIPLENIQNLTFIENPILNYLDLKILKVETAGNSTPHSSDMKLVGIMEADNFKNAVLDQRELLKKETPSSKNSSENKMLDLLVEIKNLVKEIRDK